MTAEKIVIIGGGTGGVVLANRLRILLPPPHRIVVIERSETNVFAPSLLWLMVGQRRREAIVRPLRSLLRNGVELMIGEVHAIEAKQHRVIAGSETIAYDRLILAAGAEMCFDFPGTETFFTLDGAERLHSALRGFRGGSVAVVVTSTPYKCPGAPAEGAMLIRDFLRRRSVYARIDLYTPELQPMPVAGPQLGEAVRAMLAERSIGYRPGHILRGIDDKTLIFENRESAKADLVITIPRHLPPPVVRTAGVANDLGWAAVNAQTMATNDPAIFAIGDCAAVPLPGRWMADVPLMLPKAGVFAHAQALALAVRLAASMSGMEITSGFRGDGFCMLEGGAGRAGFAYGDFFATPSPEIELREPGTTWHLAKVMFEKWWLAPPGLRKQLLAAAMHAGSRLHGISFEL